MRPTRSRSRGRAEPALLLAVLAAGLLAVGWVAADHLRGNPLALTVTLLIGACHLIGAAELWRFQRDSRRLQQALAELSTDRGSGPGADPGRAVPMDLPAWLAALPAPLQGPVRARLAGERSALPGPALTPYLVGLLVLMGMLGTFLGMVVTLNGTVAALDSSTDLQAIRATLAAPLRGLGLAFGTSVAGICASAMLGLASALCRRQRLQAAQQLDAAIAGPLRPFSRTQQRQQGFDLMQRQAEAMPALLEQLQALVQQLQAQGQATQQGLLAGQQALGAQWLTGQRELADRLTSGQRDLTDRMTTNHRELADRLTTGQRDLTDQLTADQRVLADHLQASQRQLAEGLAASQQTLSEQLQAGQVHFHQQAEAAYTGLADSVGRALERQLADGAAQATASARHAADTLQTAVERTMQGISQDTARLQADTAQTLAQQLDALVQQVSLQLTQLTQQVSGQSTTLQQQVGQAMAEAGQRLGDSAQALGQQFGDQAAALSQQIDSRLGSTLQALGDRTVASLDTLSTRVGDTLVGLGRHTGTTLDELGQRVDALLTQLGTEQRAALAAQLEQAGAQAQALQTALAQQDQARLAGWTAALADIATALRHDWQATSTATLQRQQQLSEALEGSTRRLAAQAEAQARESLAEIGRLMQAAAEAPRVAAEVTAQLRQQLSDSMARDNTVLEERQRLIDGLGTLFDKMTQTAARQQQAVDRLVESSTALLERSGEQIGDRLASATSGLQAVAGQLTGSAVEVASLGEAFGIAVQHYGQSNSQLVQQLERIEAALARNSSRSDEQLAYYVAQAREIVELSIGSQKQIVDELQQVAGRLTTAADA